MANINAKLKERQPNSDQREEFLIVIEYLLTEAYDEKHATTQQKIIEFAREKYGVEIRRDRIPQILIHLLQIQEKDPNRLPFKIKVKTTNELVKCYVEERMLSDKEIIDIASSIINDSTKTDTKSRLLTEKILDIAASENHQIELRNKINKANRKGKKLNSSAIEKHEILLDAGLEKKLVWFKFPDINKVDMSKESLNIRRLVRKTNEESKFSGFVSRVLETSSGIRVILFVEKINGQDIRIAFDTSIDNIEIIDTPIDVGDWFNELSFELDDGRQTHYESPDEWSESHYSGKDGLKHHFIVKTCIDSKNSFKKFTKIYEEFWKTKLDYQIKERIVKIRSRDENGNIVENDQVVRDAYIEIDSNLEAFRKWYMNYEIFSVTVIVKPSFYNDLLVTDLIDRLIRRVNKYGAIYNYTVTKDYKEEYKLAVMERRKRLEEHRKQKEENKESK